METTIDIVKDAVVEETQGVDDEVSKLSRDENLYLSLDGLKDTLADEMFEEAVEAVIPTVDTENSKITDSGNEESILSLENGEQNSNEVHEIQKFEEDIAHAVQGSEHSDSQPKFLINELLPLESQTDAEIVVFAENNGLHDERNAEEKEVEFKEIVDLTCNDGEIDNPSHGDEVDTEPKPDDSLSGNATSFRPLTPDDSKDLDADTGQEATDGIFEMPKFHELNGYINEMAVNQDDNEVKGSDIGSMKPGNGMMHLVTSSDTSKNDDKKTSYVVEDAIEVPLPESNGDLFHILEQNAVVSEAAPLSASKSNGDITHNLEKNDIVNKPVAIFGSGYQQEKIDILPIQCLELKNDHVVEEEETSFTSIVNLKNVDETIPMEVDLENIEFQKVNGPIVDKDKNMDVAAANTTSSADFGEGYPVVENGTANLEIQNVEKPHLRSSELLEDSHESHKEVLLNKNAEVSAALDTKEGLKDEMKEPYVSDSENQEQLVKSILPSSGNSTAIPPVSEHASKVQKPVSHDMSAVAEKEVKPAGEISSSADSKTTSSPALVGLAPLPQRIQSSAGSRESGSRSAVDIPSANNTSAPLSRPAAPLLEPTSRVAQHPRVNGAASPPHNQLVEDQNGDAADEYDEIREKLQMIRVKFLRLAHKLGQTPHNVVVAQVLYRLGLAEQLRGRSGGRVGAFSFDRASAMAEHLEAAGQEPLDFTCTIMVLGKSGVGKSATINSIFDKVMFGTDAFQLGTKKVQDIVGTVQGIRVRVIDTPGLLPSWSDQRQNEKILNSVKRFIKKNPPDIVLYLDRLDMQGRDFGETPLLRTITEIFGPSIWFNAIVVLTHAASAPPEGPNGTATGYDMFVTQRSHVVQQAIRQAAGDMRLMNPVSLVENHSACRRNQTGQRVLPNGQVWKPHLLLLSFASKILAEANTLLKLQDSPPGRPFASRTKSPSLPFLLSSLLQSRPELKLPSEQFGDDDDAIDDDVDKSSDSEEDENDYDNLPPFKSLTKAQLEKLPKSQRKAYYDELEYREKLFTKKQLKEEKRRRKMMKKMQEALKDLPTEYGENAEEESAGAASVLIPMSDLALPASFDSDNPTHRYRSLDYKPWLVRAVLEPNGWDHDIGYDGINIERLFVVKDKIPISFSGHISKDKEDANLQMEIASSVKHGKGKATSLGFDMQSVGKDMAYTMRSETRFSNSRINKAAAGFSATLLGDVLTGGVKVEDKLLIGKRGQLVVSGGGIYGSGDVAYGGSVEATVRDKDHPLGRFLSTLAVSVMDWHGDLAIGCNSQTQIPIGRFSNLVARFNINNHGSGQVSVRINSSEQLQIVLLGLIPLVKKFLGNDKTG